MGGEILQFFQRSESNPSCSCFIFTPFVVIKWASCAYARGTGNPSWMSKAPLLSVAVSPISSQYSYLCLRKKNHGVFLSSHSSVTLCAMLWNLLSTRDSRCLIWPLPLKCHRFLGGLYHGALGHGNHKVKRNILKKRYSSFFYETANNVQPWQG